jgi:hypothetical protein
MRLLSLVALFWLTGCVHIAACRPELVINTWKPLYGIPVEENGPLTVRQRLAEVESISFIQCSYND